MWECVGVGVWECGRVAVWEEEMARFRPFPPSPTLPHSHTDVLHRAPGAGSGGRQHRQGSGHQQNHERVVPRREAVFPRLAHVPHGDDHPPLELVVQIRLQRARRLQPHHRPARHENQRPQHRHGRDVPQRLASVEDQPPRDQQHRQEDGVDLRQQRQPEEHPAQHAPAPAANAALERRHRQHPQQHHEHFEIREMRVREHARQQDEDARREQTGPLIAAAGNPEEDHRGGQAEEDGRAHPRGGDQVQALRKKRHYAQGDSHAAQRGVVLAGPPDACNHPRRKGTRTQIREPLRVVDREAVVDRLVPGQAGVAHRQRDGGRGQQEHQRRQQRHAHQRRHGWAGHVAGASGAEARSFRAICPISASSAAIVGGRFSGAFSRQRRISAPISSGIPVAISHGCGGRA